MYTTYKRWILKDGWKEEEVVALVRDAIVPAYRLLPGCQGLGLERIEGTQFYLATQHWESRAAQQAAISAEAYAAWWAAYQPALARWEEMMEFEDGWETEDLLG